MNRMHYTPYTCMFLLLVMLPGCYQYRHTTDKELESVREKAKQALDYDFEWGTKPHARGGEYHSDDEVLTLKSAIHHGTLIDPVLEAFFEQLGINKADFVQACHFQNPIFNYTVQYPKSMCSQTLIYGFLSMNINDFWQIPRRKKVAQTELEITTVAAFQRILEVKAAIENAYFKYLFEKMQFATADKMNTLTKAMRESIEQKYYAGYQSDFDRYVGDSFVTLNDIRIIEQRRSLTNATTTLRNAIGLDLNNKPINIIEDTWEKLFVPLPSAEELLAYAKQQKPELQIARMRIRQAQEQQALERSKIIDNVQFGVSWTGIFPTPPSADLPTGTPRTFDFGPYVLLSLPIFDQRQMAIERVYRLEKKSRKELEALEGALLEEIHNLHANITASREKIEKYKTKLMPAVDAAMDYAQKFDATLQIGFSVFFSSGLTLVEQEFLMNAEYLNLAALTSALEKTIGGSLEQILVKYDNSGTMNMSGYTEYT